MLGEQPVVAASGIGSPEAFEDTLASLGAEIAERRRYRDHASIPFEELTGRGRVVTTEKDAARAGQLPDNVYCLEVRLEDWTPPE
jgi:tetraacyldisaccharide-1-P 4'-kinase